MTVTATTNERKDSNCKCSWTSVFTVSSCHYAFKLRAKERFQVHLSRQIQIMNYNKLVSWLQFQHLGGWGKNCHRFEVSLSYRMRHIKTEKAKKNALSGFLWNNLAAFFFSDPFLLLPQAFSRTQASSHIHLTHMPLFTFPNVFRTQVFHSSPAAKDLPRS